MSLFRVFLVISLALPLAACSKDKKKNGGETAPADGLRAQPTDTGGGASEGKPDPGEASAELEVRAPTADDLATYTADLTGDGPLMATFETAQGSIHCELFDKGAPVTVANFVGLARGMHPFKDPVSGKIEKRPYYDGTVFHRIMPQFMIQGGDPTATGEGDPGYSFATEVSQDLKHVPGTLSMANAGPDTNGSQFFITEVATPKLNGGYNVFGKCAEVDLVKKMARLDTTMQPGGDEKSRPTNTEDTKLLKVTISRGAPAGAGGATDNDGKDGKEDVKRQTTPSEQPKSSGEPDHHDD